MPQKSRRVAAKQAQLSRKKGKQAKRPVQPESELSTAQDGPAPVTERPTTVSLPEPTPHPISRKAPQENLPSPSSRPTNPYIWAELRHIGLITGIILVILAALTIVLRMR